MDNHDSYLERVALKGGLLKHFYNRTGGITFTEIMIQPELSYPAMAQGMQCLDGFMARAQDKRCSAIPEGPEIVYKDDQVVIPRHKGHGHARTHWHPRTPRHEPHNP